MTEKALNQPKMKELFKMELGNKNDSCMFALAGTQQAIAIQHLSYLLLMQSKFLIPSHLR